MTHSKNMKTAFQCSSKSKINSAKLIASIGLALGIITLPDIALAKGKAKGNTDETHLTYIEELGKRLFFAEISSPSRQACQDCHTPSAGGTNGVSGVNLKQVAVTGANPHTVGELRPPTNKYAAFIEITRNELGVMMSEEVKGLQAMESCGSFPSRVCGGAFWNGRAKGGKLTDSDGNVIEIYEGLDDKFDYEALYSQYEVNPVTHQAHASPLTNPVEQGLADKTEACQMIENTKWGAELYEYAWGIPLNCSQNIDRVFARFAVALGAWQLSEENNNFSSKRDAVVRGEATFTEQEALGEEIFFGEGRCTACHESDRGQGETSLTERFTDDSYHNVGFPRNFEIPGSPDPDPGLAATTGVITDNFFSHEGLHKTSTLREVDQRPGAGFTKAYTHNGYFKSLESLVHYYNTGALRETAEGFGITRCPTDDITEREALALNCWPNPEFPNNAVVTLGFLGDLGLSLDEEAALVAFMKTLNDTILVTEPKPYQSTERDLNRVTH